MRALVVSICLGSMGCSKLLGITDPVAGDAGGSDHGTATDGGADAPPACAPGVTFGAEASFSLGAAGAIGVSFALGELDGSQGIDLAVAMGGDIQIMAGNNAGGFTRGLQLGSAATHIVIADFDIDGDDDLVALVRGTTQVFARRQNSIADPPAFEAAQPLPVTFANVQDARSGLFDGAFVPDLIVQDDSNSQVFTANLGTPGTFSAGATLGGGKQELAFVMQLDGANRDDVVFVDTGPAVPEVKVQLSTGSAFGAAATIGNVVGHGVGAGQLAASPSPDLVIAGMQGGTIYANDGAGKFAPGADTIAGLDEGALQVADANGDGLLDLVTPTKIVLQCAAATPGGAGAFTQIEPIDATPPALLADVNKDGKLDLLRLDGDRLKVRMHQ